MVLTFQHYPYQKPHLLHRYLTDPALCDIFATKAALIRSWRLLRGGAAFGLLRTTRMTQIFECLKNIVRNRMHSLKNCFWHLSLESFLNYGVTHRGMGVQQCC